MKRLIQILMILFLTFSCNAQNIEDQKADMKNKIDPKTNIIVNKEFDENGNLIRFDSTYSYFYSNIENDSTFTDFQNNFFNSFPDFQGPFFNDMFFTDSLLMYDFYKKDFFSKRFELNRKKFDQIFEKMDSIKNKFYNDYSLREEKKKK